MFGTVAYMDKQYPELTEVKVILKKCNGLPLAIVTIGGFLAKQPKNLMEWRKLNEHISAELEMNLELRRIPNVLIRSYDGLPYHLKSCFLYLSIFPEDYNISRTKEFLREICTVNTSIYENTIDGLKKIVFNARWVVPWETSSVAYALTTPSTLAAACQSSAGATPGRREWRRSAAEASFGHGQQGRGHRQRRRLP